MTEFAKIVRIDLCFSCVGERNLKGAADLDAFSIVENPLLDRQSVLIVLGGIPADAERQVLGSLVVQAAFLVFFHICCESIFLWSGFVAQW